jgi:23S rRNA pseudouridine2605 synthase
MRPARCVGRRKEKTLEERLHKFMARCGVASRRACEQIISEGRVRVNGQVAVEMGMAVDPDADRVSVDGQPIRPPRLVYYVLNKPRHVVCTNSDPAGRTRAVDLIEGVPARVYPVGRLDADSTGLLLLTNDGELANRLTHPRFGVPKTYLVEVDGKFTGADVQRMLDGVWLSEGKARASRVKIVQRGHTRSLIEVTLREGRNREVRRVLARLGHKARRLTRISFGSLRLAGLKIGRFRKLTGQEVAALRASADRAAEAAALRDKTDGRKPKAHR